jgi:NAD(P)-dependent dehydrogenase (short-subunit alcohol dehydrogenase family)
VVLAVPGTTGANKGIGLEIALDVTDAASVQAAADWIEAEYGRLDILVNNAGIAVRGGPPSATDLAAMRAIYETNVFGEVGSITAMTDPANPTSQSPAGLAYPSSKTALNMITALYAKELRDTAVKVNAANPGYTKTDLNGNTGYRSAAEGAEPIVELATLGDDGPSGILWGHVASSAGPHSPYAPIPW